MSEHSRRIVIIIVVAVVALACLCVCCGALGVGGLEMYSGRLLAGTEVVGTPHPREPEHRLSRPVCIEVHRPPFLRRSAENDLGH